MKFTQTLVVENTIFDEMERICKEPDSSVKKDGVEFDEGVGFPFGYRMDIQVCASGDPANESCWTQGVLFDQHGNELGSTDVGESFGGEYQIKIYAKDSVIDEYIVEVKRKCDGNVTWEK